MKEFPIGTNVVCSFSPHKKVGEKTLGIVMAHQRHYLSCVGHLVKHDDGSTWVYSGDHLSKT